MTLTDTDLDSILTSMDKHEDCTSLKDSLREVIAEVRKLRADNYLIVINHESEIYRMKEHFHDQMHNMNTHHTESTARLQYELDQALKVIEKGIPPAPPIIIQADRQMMINIYALFQRESAQRAAGRMLYRPKP